MIDLIRTELDHQRSKMMIWMPILLGAGIAAYFAMRTEPSVLVLQVLAAIGLIGVILVFKWTYPVSLVPLILTALVAGFLLASLRANAVAGPVLGWRYYGSVEGVIVAIDRSASDKVRITLADPVLAKVGPDKTPKRVRVSLHSKVSGVTPEPGARVMITAHLSPPNGPTEPSGYDFQRRAWFHQLGAIGYSRMPLMLADSKPASGLSASIFALRMYLSKLVRTRVGGRAGGFAAAILTGDRSQIDQSAVQDLRRANLAHLLAISGLHMGLMTGVVFALFRYGLALVPIVAMRMPVKKIAAVAALIVGFSYLVLSGASVATERAFIMVSIMLGAVLLDRPALSLRAVAIAATLILILWPENLMEPGFQMSFAATAALVLAFGWLSKQSVWRSGGGRVMRWVRPVLSLLFSSLVAGMATAPIAAFHFNQVAHYGLIANTASLPMMGFIVMPSAISAVVLAPFGLDWIAWGAMHIGIDWILGVAHWIAEFDTAVSLVPSAQSWALGGLVVSAAFLVALQTRLRFAGVAGAIAVAMVWQSSHRPDVLLSHDGRLMGVMTEKGRSLNRDRGSGFAALSWLENDGDGADQKLAAGRGRFEDDRTTLAFENVSLDYLWKKEISVSDVADACAKSAVLVVPKWKGDLPQGCAILDAKHFKKSGSTAIWFQGGEVKMKTARQVTGTRLWNSKKIRGQ